MLRYRGLARSLARRYVRPGLGREDLEQVACVGLVKAIQGFEPERGHAFSTYAVPTILGELRHFCRQALWPVHVPRPVQERLVAIRRLVAEDVAVGGGRPTASAIAARLRCDEEDVLDAFHAGACTVLRSVDGTAGDDGGVADAWLAVEDPGFAAAEDRATLKARIGRLTDGERELVRLHYAEDLSHRQIAARLGMSASSVGRTLAATIARLSDEDVAATPCPRARTRPARVAARRPRVREAA